MTLHTVASAEADSFSLGEWSVLAGATQCCSLQVKLRFTFHTVAVAEADSFSLGVWPDLRTAGGFRHISSLWVNAIAQPATEPAHDAVNCCRC
jgi:hypothetical protein